MKNTFRLLAVSIGMVLFNSVGITQESKSTEKIEVHELPNDLTTITDENLAPILEPLADAKIIGITECVHDMVEPFHFRNALIKKLVEENEIGAIAIESGFPESRLCYDYILGKDIPIDSVLSTGFSCMFGSIESNRELLIWLRNYNRNKPSSEQVHFYGFDIPGCAPNPVLENAKAGFNYVLDYLDDVDKENARIFREAIEEYEVYLRIRDSAQDTLPHFWDLDAQGWDKIASILDSIEQTFLENSAAFIQKSAELDYKWAFRSIHNARQNVVFFRSIGDPEIGYDTRDFGQFENIQWILKNEGDKKLLLFAHSTHLMKEIHTDTATMIPYPRCGEYLAKEYGKDYKVIGNFFRKLDYLDDDPIMLGEGYLGYELSKLGPKNYFVEVNALESNWKKEWCIRKSNSGAKLLTNLGEAVDIIYFNDTQTTIFPPKSE
ncbi:MAG: erythromycin esterase family protein [Brumimicrobium sp.]|nr:erythromycin esterase family protein [Brumimicrobium sp.]